MEFGLSYLDWRWGSLEVKKIGEKFYGGWRAVVSCRNLEGRGGLLLALLVLLLVLLL